MINLTLRKNFKAKFTGIKMLTADLKQQVKKLVEDEPRMLPSEIAEQLNITEAQTVFSFKKEMCTHIDGTQAELLLDELSNWGDVTTIMHSEGSIFEVKASFPKGKIAHGYYNLMGKKGELNGHLRLDLITDIALISKPFRGNESYYFGFFSEQGKNIFKVYLGRDKKRQLLADQVEKFNKLKIKYGQ